MSIHREPLPPGQPEPGELPVEPYDGTPPPAGVPLDDDTEHRPEMPTT
jgi:hypothetical protein